MQINHEMLKNYKKKAMNHHSNSKYVLKRPNLWLTSELLPIIDREAPGRGYRHFLSKKEIIQFIYLLPEWSRIFKGLTIIKLVKGVEGSDGWYTGTTIAINAWERELWRRVPPDYYLEHKDIFKRLNVECCKQGKEYLCKFDTLSVKAFQLLHVFLHEIGHHLDKITTKSQRESSRGEVFAEGYAYRFESVVWDRYFAIVNKKSNRLS